VEEALAAAGDVADGGSGLDVAREPDTGCQRDDVAPRQSPRQDEARGPKDERGDPARRSAERTRRERAENYGEIEALSDAEAGPAVDDLESEHNCAIRRRTKKERVGDRRPSEQAE